MTEVLLHRSQSPYNTIIVCRDEDGVVTLQFTDDGPCQSAVRPEDPSYLELPYSRVLLLFLGIVPNPGRMLVLGLGGGTVPRFFHRFFPDLRIDVVEIDPVVLDVATRYCGLVQDERLRVHLADGRDFIEKVELPYDAIVLDGFDSETVPTHLRTLEFLAAVRSALHPQGVVVGNVWGRNHNPQYNDMLATYREAFEDLYILDVPAPGTKIFLASPHRLRLSRSILIERAEPVFGNRCFGFRPTEVIAGFRLGDEDSIGEGEVLRD